MTAPIFPFTAIVGQEALKRALVLNAVDPLIGGVLALGRRGTGKSTAVRALARLLPLMDVMPGCPFQCDPDRPDGWCSGCRTNFAAAPPAGGPVSGSGLPPEPAPTPEPTLVPERKPVPVVDLPLGVTEDRVTGGLDIEAALVRGEKVFEPGLLGRANRGFLYIDEVNLLEDHLIDLLLDVSAGGVNVVEREGISLQHPARFVLVGSGNPEEGDLRPQLLDRFGLFVPVDTIADVGMRVEIVRRRDAFERDPRSFLARWAEAEETLRTDIAEARRRLDEVDVPEKVLALAAELAMTLALDGHRGELTLIRSARARAALAGRRETTPEDVLELAPLALAHRLRRDPLDDLDGTERVRAAVKALRGRCGPSCDVV